jgi:hypothetical protein
MKILKAGHDDRTRPVLAGRKYKNFDVIVLGDKFMKNTSMLCKHGIIMNKATRRHVLLPPLGAPSEIRNIDRRCNSS